MAMKRKNYLLISPNFPKYHENYARALGELGVNVLAIGDAPYGELSDVLKSSLSEYYKVGSLEDYGEVLRAAGYLTWKHGKIDGVDSINEYWLELDAKLRADFNVDGVKYPFVLQSKRKSSMKKFYEAAGVKTARWALPENFAQAREFASACGYPIVVKPDIGVGAADTFTIKNEKELASFFDSGRRGYIFEEFIKGRIVTFDGLVDANGDIVISSSHNFIGETFMDVVFGDGELSFYSELEIPADLQAAGAAVLKAYNVRSQFFHFEFFRAEGSADGRIKKGDLVGLEVNMRTPGGHMIDMINYSFDIDSYRLWARVVAGAEFERPPARKYYCAYASRKYRFAYKYSDAEAREKLGGGLCFDEEVDSALSRVMGDRIFIFRSKSLDEIFNMAKIIQQKI